MKASIVMPVYLGFYPTAASNRESKLIRAIESAQTQDTKHDHELIIIIDACERAKELLTDKKAILKPTTRVYELAYDKGKRFDATHARNAGIELSTGDMVCYLDSDDVLQNWHIDKLLRTFQGGWSFFDCWCFNTAKGDWYEEKVNVWKQGKCGTCNVAHGANTAARWGVPSYGRDDWDFINKLKQTGQGTYIGSSGYTVCHCPGMPFKYDL